MIGQYRTPNGNDIDPTKLRAEHLADIGFWSFTCGACGASWMQSFSEDKSGNGTIAQAYGAMTTHRCAQLCMNRVMSRIDSVIDETISILDNPALNPRERILFSAFQDFLIAIVSSVHCHDAGNNDD